MRLVDFQKLIADEGYVVAPDFAETRKAIRNAVRGVKDMFEPA